MNACIPSQLLEVVAARECVLYAGAEFVLEASLPDGTRLPHEMTLSRRLLRTLFESEGLSPESPSGGGTPGLARLADDYEILFGRRRLVRTIADAFACHKIRPGAAHDAAVRLFSGIVTTGYDRLFETAAALCGRPWQTFHRDAQLSCLRVNDGLTLYKLHGGLDDLEGMVVTSADYAARPIPNDMRRTLESLLAQKTLVMLGCGVDESEFNEIHFEVLERLGVHKPLTFAVLPFPARDASGYETWRAFRKRWERRGVEFLDGAPSDFLQALDERMSSDGEVFRRGEVGPAVFGNREGETPRRVRMSE